MKGSYSIVHLHEYPIKGIARAIAAASNTQPHRETGIRCDHSTSQESETLKKSHVCKTFYYPLATYAKPRARQGIAQNARNTRECKGNEYETQSNAS